ncbi:photosystem I assembly protein Ycf3 [Planctomycetes bacterium Pan216]|uniref:Photosystem I assembly protein Ycf3 n=1 Tax=Kolteria novifilia TaxID=2527975 RepID=A0A518B245_9BACT|nr:photosystem I assembly protein Ycf3 [Planctomycetes bacterium Pan216]
MKSCTSLVALYLAILAASPLLAQNISQQRKLAVANRLHNRAVQMFNDGRTKDALETAEQAVKVREQVFGTGHAETARGYHNLGVMLSRVGRHAEGREYLEKALKIQQQTLGEGHEDFHDTLRTTGSIAARMGDYGSAKNYLETSLKIARERFGPEDPKTADAHTDFGTLLTGMGDEIAAQYHHEKALAIRRKVYGDKHTDTAESLTLIGGLHLSRGQDEKAKPLLEEALEIRKEVLAHDDPDMAQSYAHLGGLYEREGDYEKAKTYFKQSAAIRKRAHGTRHPGTINSLDHVARLCKRTGEFDEARRTLQQAVQIAKRELGENHRQTISLYKNLAYLHQAQGNSSEAMEIIHDSRRRSLRHVTGAIWGLTEREQLMYLRDFEAGPLSAALTLGLLAEDDPQIVAKSAEWLLNGKSIAQEATARRYLKLRDATDPITAKLFEQLNDLKGELSAFNMPSENEGGFLAWQVQMLKLEYKERQLLHWLKQSDQIDESTDPWVELDEIREALPKDGVFINIARFWPYNFYAEGDDKDYSSARYAAWLVYPDHEEVDVVYLGKAEEIDQAIDDFRNTVEPPQIIGRLAFHALPSEKKMRAQLAAIAELVLRPMEEKIKGRFQWIISADSSLWLFPWSALPLSDGKDAIENHLVTYSTTGRELILSEETYPTSRAMVFANPDYDAILDGSRPPATSIVRDATKKPAAPKTPPKPKTRPVRAKVTRRLQAAAEPDDEEEPHRRFHPVPNGEQSAQMLLPSLRQYLLHEPHFFTGTAANEGNFKKAKSPRLIMMTTHGTFIPLKLDLVDLSGLLGLVGIGKKYTLHTMIQNPLARCGLGLAGGNNPKENQEAVGEDGILTGLDIVGTDLRGTELVILQACQSGLGDVRNGEGVAGLRQAFQLAGAQAVVSTLWSVTVVDSTVILEYYWKHLAAGEGRNEALRSAKLDFMRSKVAGRESTHPYHWAAFIYTGPPERD